MIVHERRGVITYSNASLSPIIARGNSYLPSLLITVTESRHAVRPLLIKAGINSAAQSSFPAGGLGEIRQTPLTPSHDAIFVVDFQHLIKKCKYIFDGDPSDLPVSSLRWTG